jgi:hypothetical protein
MIGVTLDFNSEETYPSAGGGSGTVLTYLDNYVQESGNQNPITFSSVDFGTEASDRYIIVGYGTRNDSRTINSVTIGGVSATILVQQGDGNTTAGIAIAAVPTGTTGDVVVTLNGTADSHYLGVWSATGLASPTPVDSAGVGGQGQDAGPNTFNLNTDANGFAILVNANAAGGGGPEDPGAVSANLTLRFDGITTTPDHTNGAMAGADGLTDGTLTTFEINVGDNNNNDAAVAVTFEGTAGGPPANKKNSGIWDVTGVLDSIVTGGGGGGNYELGLSPSLFTISGTNNAWTQQTVDISAYAGATARLVFRYQNGDGFEGDIQLDAISFDGNFYTFELSNTTEGFETSTADDSPTYAGVTWATVANQSNVDGYWQVDTGGTPSNNTGRTDAADGNYYIYAETSAPANVLGYNFWLRSPEVTLSGSPTLTFFEARNGGNIGTLDVHLDVIS